MNSIDDSNNNKNRASAKSISKSTRTKKRKRESGTGNKLQQRYEIEKQDRYDKIYYQCTKDIQKQIKISKLFIQQKLIRKIKECKYR